MTRTVLRYSKTTWSIVLGGCLIVTVLFFKGQDARFAWQQWHAANLALALDRSDAPLAMEIGNYYFGSVPLGNTHPSYDPALAQRAFEKALAIQPGILWGHYSLARIYFVRSDFADALTQINAELAANPENLRSLYVRGLIYGYRDLPGDLALAEADLRTFALWAPAEWAGYNDLSWILLREAKYQETLGVLDVAFQKVSHADQNPWLLNDRGLAYLDLGNNAQAAVSFQSALNAASSLTQADWRHAYSGDDPASDSQGLDAFRNGLEENLKKAQASR